MVNPHDSDTSLAKTVQNIARSAAIALMLQTDIAGESECHSVAPSTFSWCQTHWHCSFI